MDFMHARRAQRWATLPRAFALAGLLTASQTLPAQTLSAPNAVAIGPAALASGSASVAVGSGATASGAGAVALGASSIAAGDNTLSVGSVGAERQITNVAAGTASTDVVNLGQLDNSVLQSNNWAASYTDQRALAVSNQLQQTGNRAYSGVAGAMSMAGLPQAYSPGKSMISGAIGTFRSESSAAVGISTISDSGRWVYKTNGSIDSRGDAGLSVGAGMQW